MSNYVYVTTCKGEHRWVEVSSTSTGSSKITKSIYCGDCGKPSPKKQNKTL